MSLPPITLLNDTHSFPGNYTFKIIGISDPTFPSRVAAVIKEELKWEKEPAYTVKKSETGKHQSITMDLEMQSAEEVHLVYKRLVVLPGVLMLL